MLEQITATRYVTPLKEGGSLPGVVEADDCGTYVLKFRGAGQGVKVLVAEVLVGELARRLGLRVPRLAVVDLQAPIARYEADEEVQDLLNASLGLNPGHRLPAGVLRVRRVAATLGRGVRGDPLARRPHRERRPDLEQPQPAGVARRAVVHRPRGRALLPPPVAEPGARPGPLRGAAVRHLEARAGGRRREPPRGARAAVPARHPGAGRGGDGPGARRLAGAGPRARLPRRRPRGLPGAPAGRASSTAWVPGGAA